jgi:dTDP-4-dehydrorhamnose 3,5-epimerase
MITHTSIAEVLLVEPQVFGDARGYIMETYHARKFAAGGIEAAFVQDNQSGSRQGVLRGLHYQYRQPQGKLVRVICGEVFDVAVDVRPSSPTFGKWVGARLSAENKLQLWMPAGFAHGFYVLSEWAEVVYKVTDFYEPKFEATLLWNDSEVGIDWPLIRGQAPILSDKDVAGTLLRETIL